MKSFIISIITLISITKTLSAQTDSLPPLSDTLPHIITDTIPPIKIDTTLRILNFTPYITQHVDSTLYYQFIINRTSPNYHWYIREAPVGLRINKDNGILSFKSEKNFFLSGKLKYDFPYHVRIGIENKQDPAEKIDTTFTIQFYNTEIIPSRLKPTIASTLTIDEGEQVSFRVQCEDGSFPINNILFSSSVTIKNYKLVKNCNDEFSWTPDYDFVKETDSARTRIVLLSFIGSAKNHIRDTAAIRLIVKDALNYPLAVQQYQLVKTNIENYVLQLKYSFIQLDKKVKKTKTTRTTFDLTTATSSMTGTILNASADNPKAGKILPGVGISLVPIKEALAPNKNVEQNQAALIRTSIKRLEFLLTDNQLTGEKDPDISRKTNRLREELKQTQVQLIDVPVELTTGMTPEDLNRYFNSTKVNKKYRLKR